MTDLELPTPPLPGDEIFIGAVFTRVFPWEPTGADFLDQLEADSRAELEALGYGLSVSERGVHVRDEGAAHTTYFGHVVFRIYAIPATVDGEPRMVLAGLPAAAAVGAVLFALGAGLGLFIAYSVADVEVLEAGRDTLNAATGTLAEGRRLVVQGAAAIAILWLLYRYAPR